MKRGAPEHTDAIPDIECRGVSGISLFHKAQVTRIAQASIVKSGCLTFYCSAIGPAAVVGVAHDDTYQILSIDGVDEIQK